MYFCKPWICFFVFSISHQYFSKYMSFISSDHILIPCIGAYWYQKGGRFAKQEITARSPPQTTNKLGHFSDHWDILQPSSRHQNQARHDVFLTLTKFLFVCLFAKRWNASTYPWLAETFSLINGILFCLPSQLEEYCLPNRRIRGLIIRAKSELKQASSKKNSIRGGPSG